MCEKQETEDWLVHAEEMCRYLKENLQKRCAATRTFEKGIDLSFWVECLKEALLFRSTELAATAIDLYQQNKMVSAATITRTLLETTALFNRLHESCANVVKKHKKGKCSDEIIQEFSERVGKISLASTAADATQPNIEPYEVRALISSLDTRFKTHGMAKRTYDEFCQIGHPNFRGCLDAYTKWDQEKRYMEFVQDYHHWELNAAQYHLFVFIILKLAKNLEEEMSKLLPNFAKALEEYLERKPGDDNEKDTC